MLGSRGNADWFLLRQPPHPPKPAILFNERCVAARNEEWCYERKYLHLFPWLHKGLALSNDDIEGAGGRTVYHREIRPGGSGLKTGEISLKKSWGGYRGTTPHRSTCSHHRVALVITPLYNWKPFGGKHCLKLVHGEGIWGSKGVPGIKGLKHRAPQARKRLRNRMVHDPDVPRYHRGAADSKKFLWAPHIMRSSISCTRKNDLEGVIRSRNPTKRLCPSPKQNMYWILVKLLDQWLTGSSSLEDLNRKTGTLLINPTTAAPTVGWLVPHLRMSIGQQVHH